MEVHREFEVHFAFYIQLLTGSCFILLSAIAFSMSCFQEMSAPADKLVPAHLSRKKKRQPATLYRSSKRRYERSCPQEKHLFLPFASTSLGTQQRVTATPKRELSLLTGQKEQGCTNSGLTTGHQEQGIQGTKQNHMLLFDPPLPSRHSHPSLLNCKPEHGCNSLQLSRQAQTQRSRPSLPSSISLPSS